MMNVRNKKNTTQKNKNYFIEKKNGKTLMVEILPSYL